MDFGARTDSFFKKSQSSGKSRYLRNQQNKEKNKDESMWDTKEKIITIRGNKNQHVRKERHCYNAEKIVDFLRREV